MAKSDLCMMLVFQTILFAQSRTIHRDSSEPEINSQLSTTIINKMTNRMAEKDFTTNDDLFSPTIKALKRHFKWERIALVVWDSAVYRQAGRAIEKAFRSQVVSITYERRYYRFEDYQTVVDTLKNISCKANVIILLGDIRNSKEYLEAAYDMKLISGDYLFVTFEFNMSRIVSRQQRPFKWCSIEFCDGTFSSFLARSYNLCMAWKSAILVMLKLPSGLIDGSGNKESVDLYQAEGRTEVIPNTDMDLNFRLDLPRELHSAPEMMYDAAAVKSPQDETYTLGVYRYGRKDSDSCSVVLGENLMPFEPSKKNYPTMEEVGEFKSESHCVSCGDDLQVKFNKAWNSSGNTYDVGHARKMVRKDCR